MKKLLVITLVLFLWFWLASCKKDKTEESNESWTGNKIVLTSSWETSSSWEILETEWEENPESAETEKNNTVEQDNQNNSQETSSQEQNQENTQEEEQEYSEAEEEALKEIEELFNEILESDESK